MKSHFRGVGGIPIILIHIFDFQLSKYNPIEPFTKKGMV